MSYFVSGLAGASLAALSFGFIPLAVGGDRTTATDHASAIVVQNAEINRAAKGDKIVSLSQISGKSAVVSQVVRLASTSVVIKSEASHKMEARDISTGPRRRTVACEPVVSVLSEAARQLDSSRCIT